jgi:hypothetical protein
MDPILNKQTEKNTRLLLLLLFYFYFFFIALVRELLDRTVYAFILLDTQLYTTPTQRSA